MVRTLHTPNPPEPRTARYQQAIESFKPLGDNTWHAGALEGLCCCTVLEAHLNSAGVIMFVSPNRLHH